MLKSINTINIHDYNYPLADERIAKYPLADRDKSKLLVYDKGTISDDVFSNVSSYLSDDYLMVFNNTKVIQARLSFHKSTGAAIEIFLLEPHCPSDYEQIFQAKGACEWVCMIGNLKKWKAETLETQLFIDGKQVTVYAEKLSTDDANQCVKLSWTDGEMTFAELLDTLGQLPIPPYLNRKTEESDKTSYQTVYSKIKGSVAAPTAGLHFTPLVLDSIRSRKIMMEELTLHVGAGTFKPVKSEFISGHEMHREFISVPHHVIRSLIDKKGNAVAVGTTSVRTVESLYYIGRKIMKDENIQPERLSVSQWEPYDADSNDVAPIDALQAIDRYMQRHGLTILNSSTKIMIVPGYKYKYVRMLITNFHQPQSTLLLLVSAFIGDDWKRVYDHALHHGYRFLSYGDSSLLIS